MRTLKLDGEGHLSAIAAGNRASERSSGQRHRHIQVVIALVELA